MTPDEVCEALVNIGADVSRRTLLRYEEAGLIPKPERGGGGLDGRFTNYPEWTIEEAYTAWSFIHGKYGYGQSFFGDKTPKIAPAAVKKFRDEYYSKIEIDEFMKTEEYKQSIKEDNEKHQQNIEEYEANIREHPEEFAFRENDSNDLRNHARMQVNLGFSLLWESERLWARELLNKKALE